MAENVASAAKLSLPAFLKVLTTNSVPAPKAIAVAGKIYKTHNSADALSKLTDSQLSAAGVKEKEDRNLVLAAVRKAGYKKAPARKPITKTEDGSPLASTSASAASTSSPSPRKKRRRQEDRNEFLPDGPNEEGESFGSLDFKEVLDEDAVKTKSTVVNRAPVMTAWATVVAERLGFGREEALSIASVYTELNAISKGVSIGVYEKSKAKGVEAERAGSQPFVEIMGRRVPLYKSQSGQWRALSSGTPVSPATAYSYITRSLRQTAPHVLGALRLLARSFTPRELNDKGFALYAEFRPEVKDWGERASLRCADILALRKAGGMDADAEEERGAQFVKTEAADNSPVPEEAPDEPDAKRVKTTSLEEYEAALDGDIDFADLEGIP